MHYSLLFMSHQWLTTFCQTSLVVIATHPVPYSLRPYALRSQLFGKDAFLCPLPRQ